MANDIYLLQAHKVSQLLNIILHVAYTDRFESLYPAMSAGQEPDPLKSAIIEFIFFDFLSSKPTNKFCIGRVLLRCVSNVQIFWRVFPLKLHLRWELTRTSNTQDTMDLCTWDNSLRERVGFRLHRESFIPGIRHWASPGCSNDSRNSYKMSKPPLHYAFASLYRWLRLPNNTKI